MKIVTRQLGIGAEGIPLLTWWEEGHTFVLGPVCNITPQTLHSSLGVLPVPIRVQETGIAGALPRGTMLVCGRAKFEARYYSSRAWGLNPVPVPYFPI